MSISRSTRRAEQGKELDREQWAALGQIDYNIRVEGRGQATAGPFYFGRAFDSPPYFTYSAVAEKGDPGIASHFTVGVAEWIRDDQGMYIGANLWIIFDACFEEQRIIEEDFEDTLARQGAGPDGNEIFIWSNNGIGWPSQNNFQSPSGMPVPIQIFASSRVEDSRHFVDLLVRGILRSPVTGGALQTFNSSVYSSSDPFKTST